ncbi:Gfo/Idh/MocA family protein [Sanguibacter massiliensis]|uniref:Gfo/Idh/MocA family protein n=1 Tax=Sanguibacter massiliensis TaxID=1973217 RepID=UPI000C81DBE7|nr:Gfo/Idh/MocA family oxidoreductase [Sanguibacter massiliensis]
MANLRAGVIGIGAMGRHHVRVFREMDGVDLVAVADPGGDPFRVAGKLEVLPDAAALADAGIDLAVVAVPTRFHEETALTLAAAGVHTLVEKPVAVDSAAGERMAKAFDDAGLVGAVGHIERYNPAIQEVRRRIADGQLGEVYQISTRRQGPFPARIADVGVILDLASHDIDLTAWAAQSTYTTVSAQTSFRSGREHEDMVLITGRLANGVNVNHTVNWLSPMKERLTVVAGERGTLIADTATADVTFYENGRVQTEWDAVAAFRGVAEGDVTRYAIAKREPLRTELEAFRDAVLGGENRTVSMAEGLATLRVAEAAKRSAQTQETVRL